MLLLLFQIDESLYAIDAAEIIEIVPMVLLTQVPAAPNSVAGVFNYHGNIVPAIDLCQLIRGTPCQPCHSTRMIIVQDAAHPAKSVDRNFNFDRLGLIAERVTETLKVDIDRFSNTKQVSTVSYLGELLIAEKGLIQQVYWQHLITEADQNTLFAEDKNQANGTGSN